MARIEQDREDLLRDARALLPRGEFLLPCVNDPVVIGYRKQGAVSVYLGQDPALHFNSHGELRRGYVDDRLLKAVDGRLVQMQRVRQEGEVQLRSRPLADEQQQAMLERVGRWLSLVRDGLSSHAYELVGQVPEDGDLVDRSLKWLHRVSSAPVVVADSPRVV